MNITTLPKTLTYNQVKALRTAFGHFYDQEDTSKFVDRQSGFRFENVTKFVDYLYSSEIGIPKGTSAKIIGITLESWYETVTKAPEFSEPTMTPAPEYAVSSNTLSPQQLEQFAKEDRSNKALQQKANADAKIQVEAALKKKQENWEKLQQQKLPKVPPKEIQEKVVAELKDKVLYAVPDKKVPEITLTKEEQTFVKIAQADPKLFADKLAALIVERNPDVPKDVLEPLSQVVAVDAAQSLSDPLKKPIPTGVFTAILGTSSQIENLSSLTQDELAKTSSLLTVFSENKEGIYRTLLVQSVGENITNKILGFPETTYHLSTSEADGSYSLKFDQLQSNSFSLQQGPVSDVLNNPLFDSSKSLASGELKNLALTKIQSLPNPGLLGNISRFTNSRAFDSVAPFLGFQTQATYIGTNFFGKTITTLLPNYAPLISNVAGKLGIDIGISAITPVATEKAAELGSVVAKGAIGKGLMAVATKIGLGSTITAIGQALGSFAPIVGNAIAFVATWLIGKIAEKINWAKVKEWSAAILGGVAGLIALPFVGLGAAIGIGVGTTAVSAGLGAGLGGTTLAGIGSGIAGFFGALGGAFLGAIGMPILVTLLVFPVVVALILFIINSGAYVVPPTGSTGSFNSENPYISVEKTAGSKSSFDNSTLLLPLTVEYTIKITAKISPLSNVRLDYKCGVLRKGTKPNCPDIGDAIPKTDTIGTISPSNSYSFKYTMTYSGNSFADSFISDTITVTADTPDKSNVTTSGSASIIIGKPDIGCYKVLTDGQYAVPSQYMKMYNDSVFKIIQDWPAYVAKTCPASGGQVTIGYGGPDAYWGWHIHSSTVDFILYQQPVSTTLVRTEFTMIHELGHHIEKVNPQYYIQYVDYPGIVIPICSYSATWGGSNDAKAESFSETMGLYGSGRSLGDSLSCAGETATFKEKYPINWKFADTFIFH